MIPVTIIKGKWPSCFVSDTTKTPGCFGFGRIPPGPPESRVSRLVDNWDPITLTFPTVFRGWDGMGPFPRVKL